MLINLGKAPPKIWIPINVNHVIFISLLALAASTSTRMQMRLHHTWKLLHGCKSELPEHRGKLKAQCSRHLWAMSCVCSRISCLTRKMFDVGASANKGKVIDYQRTQKDSISKSYIIEGSLEVKLPTIWTDEKQSRAEAERRERVRRKKMQMREKVGKSRNTVFFPMVCGSGGQNASQQLTSPIASYLWNFRHRLVRYYWYMYDLLSRRAAVKAKFDCHGRSPSCDPPQACTGTTGWSESESYLSWHTKGGAQARWKTMGVWRWTKKLSNHPLLPVVHSRLFFLYIPNLGLREQ